MNEIVIATKSIVGGDTARASENSRQTSKKFSSKRLKFAIAIAFPLGRSVGNDDICREFVGKVSRSILGGRSYPLLFLINGKVKRKRLELTRNKRL